VKNFLKNNLPRKSSPVLNPITRKTRESLYRKNGKNPPSIKAWIHTKDLLGVTVLCF
jgi:hypothetical protein